VVILDVKFCEPELFDAPLIVAGLRESGVPVLILETEMEPRTPAGMLTRMEAFLETLS
jgi:benzoyl-CoA reductase/2-hydroxyglutaryl-CoA dehydratase subunit BcrC/BadD/HgdB